MKQYQNYSVKDFVMDESFEKWILNSNPDLDRRWQVWLDQYPEKKPDVEQAKQIILSIDFQKTPADQINDGQMFERIMSAIHAYEENSASQNEFTVENYKQSKRSPHRRIGIISKIAATITLIMLSVLTYYFIMGNSTVQYATGYGEMKTIILPDSSVVTLNANSQLTFNREWGTGKEQAGLFTSFGADDPEREVWLDGEGYFQVKKNRKTDNEEERPNQKNYKNFIVHTENMVVEVLGTVFNVNNRRGKTQVVLNAGKVKLNLRGTLDKKQSNGKEGVIMEPGELVEYAKESEQLTRKQVDPEVYTSWKDNLLVFKQTSLSEIKNMIEDQYGKEVTISSDSLAKMTFTAKIPENDLEILLKAIEESFNINIVRKDDKIIMQNKKE